MSKTLTSDELHAALKTLIEKGLTFGSCTQAFGAKTPAERAYVEEAQTYQKDGEMEIDSGAVVSESYNGAYVMAWVWVSDSDVWTGPTDTEGDPCLFLNLYRHEDCDQAEGDKPPAWTDQWSCACNDECPNCGAEIEPYESIELDITGQPINEPETTAETV